MSSRIPQARRDPIDRRSEHVVKFLTLLPNPCPAQEFRLHDAHGINIGISQPNRSRQDVVVLEQTRSIRDFEQQLLSPQELRFENLEDARAQWLILNQRGI